jgi:thiosulfate/3-mercaptopyruvate sulfurtransferase
MRFLKPFVLIFAAVALFGFQQSDPWRPTDLLDPAAAAAKLKAKRADRPLVLQVGFEALYKSTRIPGAKYAGPGSTEAGLANLEDQVKDIPHDRAILIYCGCCPMEKCPNIRPAFKALHELGFSNVQVLKIPTNMHTDWAEPGYPLEKGS